MIVTGLPAVLVGGAIFVMLTDRPEQAHWLSADERQELIASLGVSEPPRPSLRDGLTNFWSWNCAWIYFLLVCGGYGISFWMPTLFSRAGVESAAEIGLLVVIPNLVGGIAMILLSRNSDRTQERRWHLSGCFVLGAIGYGIVAVAGTNIPVTLLGLSIALAGILSAIPISWTVPGRMLSPSATVVGIAIIASVGNLGGFAAPVLMGNVSVTTGSLSGGFAIIGALLLLGALWSAVTVRMPSPHLAGGAGR